jgi:8-oxo-dGTP pyrophosphatase MutT (NUDIX family)
MDRDVENLIDLDWRQRERRVKRRRKSGWQTSGGVVLHVETGRVLVVNNRREGWTWPKGIIDAGEGPVFAALREIEEEAGVLAEPIDRILVIETKRALRHYYLLTMIRDGLPTSSETMEVCWVSLVKAKKLLLRKRDRLVLRAAREWILEARQDLGGSRQAK